ncbi:MAG: hypothetical protein ACJ8G1_22055 [Vitreoscilla sp.]
MFKPLTRNAKNPPKTSGGFAETQFLHLASDDDYSGFAPTEMFGDEEMAAQPEPAAPGAARAAASTSQSVLERAAATAAQSPDALQQAQATSQWVAAQEARAHEAADQARAVIAAQRRAEEQLAEGALASGPAVPRTGLARLRAAFERLLPGGLLPLFIGVTVTMALISTALPLIDRP